MSRELRQRVILQNLVIFATTVLLAGCTSLNLPGLKLENDSTRYVPVGVGESMGGFDENVTASIYQKMRQARSENAIVLHIPSDDDPARVLPLPPGGQSVFVSTLLKQTGVLGKFRSVDVSLFRSSAHVIGGIRMDVEIDKDAKVVRPECDYALQPGDRILVEKPKTTALDGIGTIIGL